MKTLTRKLIEKFTAEAEYHWNETFAALADGLKVTAERHRAKYNRFMFAVKYLQSRQG